MKKICLAFIILTASMAGMAQENKPTEGFMGVGYGVSFFPTMQHVNFTYMVSNRIEVGGTLGFLFSRVRNSTFDSLPVEGTGFVTLPGQEEKRTVTTTATVFITPLFKYHFDVKNNLDVYLGANLPIGVGTGTKTVTSDIITASNYNSAGTVTTTPPVNVSVGAGLLLGCQYFFYKNLAVGAEANLGFTATIANGNNKTVTAGSETGSNNPANGATIPTVTTKQMVKYDAENLGMLHTFALSATWYFGKSK
jgi:hypothetical protein